MFTGGIQSSANLTDFCIMCSGTGVVNLLITAGITNDANPTIGTKLSSLNGSRFCFIISSVVAAVPKANALLATVPALENNK